MRYRPVGGQTWLTGHPLCRIRPEWIDSGAAPVTPVDAYAGTIFGLVPGTIYEIEVTIGTEVLTGTRSTRALPPAAGSPNKTANPSNLQSVLDGLVPGDVLELANGTYTGSYVYDSPGTQGSPIYVRGESKAGVVLNNTLVLYQCSHVVFENFTRQGPGVDSGILASAVGINFNSVLGGGNQNVTFRDLVIDGVDRGIASTPSQSGVLVYRCTFNGNNDWTQDLYVYNGSGAPGGGDGTPDIDQNLFWNDSCFKLPGEGNCTWNCDITGFGDTTKYAEGTIHFSAACYHYRHRIRDCGDDGFEADSASRSIGMYDNHITNAGTAVSFSDNVFGGPFWYFRNIVVNTPRGPWKLNNTNTNLLIYNNTIIRTDGKDLQSPDPPNDPHYYGTIQFNAGAIRGWSFRNNLIYYLPAAGVTGDKNIFLFEAGPVDPLDFDHNAWYPSTGIGGEFAFGWGNFGGEFASLAATSGISSTSPNHGTSTKRHANDVALTIDPFETAIPLGADHHVPVPGEFIPMLKVTETAKNAGVAIANITDGYSGAAPDIGAVIAGRALASWGVPTDPQALLDVRAMSPNTWYEIQGSSPSANLPDTIPPQRIEQQNLIEAWCGGALGNQRFFVHGGGHLDYSGNEAPYFNLATMAWVWPADPDYEPAIIDGNPANPSQLGEFSNGRPISFHTYHSLCADSQGCLLRVGGRNGWSQTGNASSPKLLRYNPDTDVWSTIRATDASFNIISVLSPDEQYIWAVDYGGLGRLRRFTIATGALDNYTDSPNEDTSAYFGADIDRARNNLVAHNLQLLVFDLDNPNNPHVVPSSSGDTAGVLGQKGTGLAYRTVNNLCYVWNRSSQVWTLDANPAGAVWTALGPAGGPGSISVGSGGVFGRWRYWPEEDRFVLIPNWSSNIWVYRPA